MHQPLIFTCFFALSSICLAAPSDSIQKWMNQLGDDSFVRREQAEAQLRKMPLASILSHLQQASQSKDREIRRRARRLLRFHQLNTNTTRHLKPQRVSLNYRDLPLTLAIEDLAAKTGLPLQLKKGALKSLGDRKINIQAKDLTHWEALHLLCEKGELREVAAVTLKRPTTGTRSYSRGNRQVIWMNRYRNSTLAVKTFINLDTGLRDYSTFAQGALRGLVRATRTGNDGDLEFLLQTEKRLNLRAIMKIQINQAGDERGQVLRSTGIFQEKQHLPDYGNREVLLIVDPGTEMKIPDTFSQSARVKIRGSQPIGKVLTEVKGRVAVLIESPGAEAVFQIDDLLTADRKERFGPSGSSLQILKAERKNGLVTVQFRLRPVKKATTIPRVNFRGGRVRVIQVARGIARLRNTTATAVSTSTLKRDGITLRDERGKVIGIQSGGKTTSTVKGSELTIKIKTGAKRIQLTYRAQKETIVEVPFTLKNVRVR